MGLGGCGGFMDPVTFAVESYKSGIGTLLPFFSGNALGEIEIPNFADPRKTIRVGEGVNVNMGWTKFKDVVKENVPAP